MSTATHLSMATRKCLLKNKSQEGVSTKCHHRGGIARLDNQVLDPEIKSINDLFSGWVPQKKSEHKIKHFIHG